MNSSIQSAQGGHRRVQHSGSFVELFQATPNLKLKFIQEIEMDLICMFNLRNKVAASLEASIYFLNVLCIDFVIANKLVYLSITYMQALLRGVRQYMTII
jgi:hypothetical protein